MSLLMNGLYRAFDDTFRAIDTAVWIDDDKLVAFVKALDRADNNTPSRHALETSSGHDVGH